MSSKLTVLFYIILSIEVGIVLTLLPWVSPFGLSDWGDNYFLLYAARKLGSQTIQRAVSSGWVRGAVTGLGLLNLFLAGWEIAHFKQTVRNLDGEPTAPKIKDVVQSNQTDNLSNN
jgi:hypothetical protein